MPGDVEALKLLGGVNFVGRGFLEFRVILLTKKLLRVVTGLTEPLRGGNVIRLAKSSVHAERPRRVDRDPFAYVSGLTVR